MSIKARLDKLQRLTGGDYCTHQPIRVCYGDDRSKQEGAQDMPPEPPEPEPCWCGAPAVLLKVVYETTARELGTT